MASRSDSVPYGGRQPLRELIEGHRATLWPIGVLLIVAGLVLWPLTALVFGALRSDTPGAPDAVFTLENHRGVYLGLLGDGWTGEAAFNSIALAVADTVVAESIGVLLDWSVTGSDIPGRSTFEERFLVLMLTT